MKTAKEARDTANIVLEKKVRRYIKKIEKKIDKHIKKGKMSCKISISYDISLIYAIKEQLHKLDYHTYYSNCRNELDINWEY